MSVFARRKFNEHGFLFGVEVSADRQHLAVGVVWVKRDLLGPICRLKTARVALGLWSLSGQGFETSSVELSTASQYSTHLMSHSYACSKEELTVMNPFGLGIFSFW